MFDVNEKDLNKKGLFVLQWASQTMFQEKLIVGGEDSISLAFTS